jgi:hypothetical protein
LIDFIAVLGNEDAISVAMYVSLSLKFYGLAVYSGNTDSMEDYEYNHESWKFSSKIVAVTSDGASVMRKAVALLTMPHVYCMNHRLHVVVKTSIEESDLQIWNNMRDLITAVRQSPLASDQIQFIQEGLDLTPLRLKSVCPTRWNNWATAMERVIDDRVWHALMEFNMRNHYFTKKESIPAELFTDTARQQVLELLELLEPVRQFSESLSHISQDRADHDHIWTVVQSAYMTYYSIVAQVFQIIVRHERSGNKNTSSVQFGLHLLDQFSSKILAALCDLDLTGTQSLIEGRNSYDESDVEGDNYADNGSTSRLKEECRKDLILESAALAFNPLGIFELRSKLKEIPFYELLRNVENNPRHRKELTPLSYKCPLKTLNAGLRMLYPSTIHDDILVMNSTFQKARMEFAISYALNPELQAKHRSQAGIDLASSLSTTLEASKTLLTLVHVATSLASRLISDDFLRHQMELFCSYYALPLGVSMPTVDSCETTFPTHVKGRGTGNPLMKRAGAPPKHVLFGVDDNSPSDDEGESPTTKLASSMLHNKELEEIRFPENPTEQHAFRGLLNRARSIIRCITATSDHVESAFSTAGRVIGTWNTQLKDDAVTAMVMLTHSFEKLGFETWKRDIGKWGINSHDEVHLDNLLDLHSAQCDLLNVECSSTTPSVSQSSTQSGTYARTESVHSSASSPATPPMLRSCSEPTRLKRRRRSDVLNSYIDFNESRKKRKEKEVRESTRNCDHVLASEALLQLGSNQLRALENIVAHERPPAIVLDPTEAERSESLQASLTSLKQLINDLSKNKPGSTSTASLTRRIKDALSSAAAPIITLVRELLRNQTEFPTTDRISDILSIVLACLPQMGTKEIAMYIRRLRQNNLAASSDGLSSQLSLSIHETNNIELAADAITSGTHYEMANVDVNRDPAYLKAIRRSLLEQHPASVIRETTQLTNNLRSKNLSIFNIIGDGNCLFRTLAYQLTQLKKSPVWEDHIVVRQAIVDFVHDHKSMFDNFMVMPDGSDWPEIDETEEDRYETEWRRWKSNMSQRGAYGDHVCVLACATLWNVKIAVVTSSTEPSNTRIIEPVEGVRPARRGSTLEICIGHLLDSHYVGTVSTQ